MTGFVVRRGLRMVLVLFAVSVLTFLIFFATPGIDPARRLAGKNPDPVTVAHIRHAFGLDRPLPVQYALMMNHLLIHRDLVSYASSGVRVVPTMLAAAPVTLSLVFGTVVIWVILSVLMGVTSAVSHGKPIDPVLMTAGMVGISLPVFWLGEVANLITQDRLHDTFLFHWVPPLGYVSLARNPWQWFLHLLIPWLVLAVGYIGLYGRILRSSLLEVEHEDYIRTARAKGLSERRVLYRHAVRTAMITFVTLLGLDLGGLLGGAIVTEVVFGLPGIGLLTYNALSKLDLPTIMATVIYGAFFIVLANAVVDVLYTWLDPRTRPA
ncbi:MAG: ABC transporter permease [Actinobacteria bacterium]|nr:ABC transporter permease [Actinomycetota bacterium]